MSLSLTTGGATFLIFIYKRHKVKKTMTTVTINGKQFNVKQTLRAAFLFEQIKGEQFAINTMLDQCLYYYCVLVSSNPDTPLTFKEYEDAIDNDDKLLETIGQAIDQQQTVERLLDTKDDGNNKKISISELFAILTLQLGIAPDYVLDVMQNYEISALMDYAHYRYKDEWEQARLIAYVTAQVNSTKRLKLENIVKFKWDDEGMGKAESQKVTKEQIERMQAMAQSLINVGAIS